MTFIKRTLTSVGWICAAVLLAVLVGNAFVCTQFSRAENLNGASRAAATSVAPSALFEASDTISLTDNVALTGNLTAGYTGKYDLRYTPASERADNEKSGVLVRLSSDRDVLRYKNTIRIDGYTKDDILLSLAITPRKPGRFDYSGLRIRLIDADDETNWFYFDIFGEKDTLCAIVTSDGVRGGFQYSDLVYQPGKAYHEYEGHADFIQGMNWLGVNSPTWGYEQTFYRYGLVNPEAFPDEKYTRETERPAGLDESVTGPFRNAVAMTDMYVPPLTVSYDVATGIAYLGGQPVFDLRHAAATDNRPFKGFSHNRIRLEVEAYNIVAETADFVVLEVDGCRMDGTDVTAHDTVAPYIVERLPSGCDADSLPEAQTGRAYPLYQTYFHDVIDGDIRPEITVQKGYTFDPNAQSISTDGASFTPTETGWYTLRYAATDRAGNESDALYRFSASASPERISVLLGEETYDDGDVVSGSANVGDKVAVPVARVHGGSGTVTLRREVVRLSDGVSSELQDDWFIPELASEYLVTYTAVDYIGRTAHRIAHYTVTAKDAPNIGATPVFPKTLVHGVPMAFPAVTAYSFDGYGQKYAAVTEIIVAGIGDKESVAKTVKAGEVFTPNKDKFGDVVRVTYTVKKHDGSASTTLEPYTASIIAPVHMWEYLRYDDNAYTRGYNTFAERSNPYVSFEAKTDGATGEIEWIHPSAAEGFECAVSSPDATRFDDVRLTLRSIADSAQAVTVRLYRNAADGKTYVAYNGQTRAVNESLHDAGGVTVAWRDGVLTDRRGEPLFAVPIASASVQASVALSEAQQGAQIRIHKLSKTRIGAIWRGTATAPQLREDYDVVEPSLQIQGSITSEYTFGEQVLIPSAAAFDDGTPYTVAEVSILYGEETLVRDRDATAAFSFVFDRYGEYTVVYQATDARGNMGLKTFTVNVFDKTPPVLDYRGKDAYRVKQGKNLKLPVCNVFDAMDAEAFVRVYAVIDCTYIDVTGRGEYGFTKKGKYILRYVGVDRNGNYAILDIPVTVE